MGGRFRPTMAVTWVGMESRADSIGPVVFHSIAKEAKWTISAYCLTIALFLFFYSLEGSLIGAS